jgi:hypothetical protein
MLPKELSFGSILIQVVNKQSKIFFLAQNNKKCVIQKESTAEMPIQSTAVDSY